MADISVTPADVLALDGSESFDGIAGETLTAGLTVYRHTDGKLYKADVSTVAKANCRGVTLNGADADQPVKVCRAGPLNPGGTVAVGQVYCVSSTGGGIAPYDAVDGPGAGEFVTTLGIGLAAGKLNLNIDAGGVAVPGGE